MITIPTSTASTLLASVSSFLADPGLLAVVGVAIGLPLGFWVVKRIIGLVPKSK